MTKKILKAIKPYVAYNPKIRGGKAVYRGTRIPIEYIIEHFYKGWGREDIKKLFPEITIDFIDKVTNIIFAEPAHDQKRKKIQITWLAYA